MKEEKPISSPDSPLKNVMDRHSSSTNNNKTVLRTARVPGLMPENVLQKSKKVRKNVGIVVDIRLLCFFIGVRPSCQFLVIKTTFSISQ
jgi:hypothetical protein